MLIQLRAGGGLMMATDIAGFAAAWALMMAAMMLPSVAPVGALYARSVAGDPRRLVGFAAGYLAVWAASAVPAFALVNVGQSVVMRFRAGAVLAAAAFLLVALYQLSPLKQVCLEKCRSPLSLLFQYSSYRGRLRDLRAGAHHGLYCLGCCWALMLVLPVVGMLNLVALILITAFVALEKNFMRGLLFSRLVAAAAAILAVGALFLPQLSSGLSMG